MKLVTAAALAAMATPAMAQNSDWTYAASIYGWVPGLGTTVSTAFGDLDMNMSGSDVLSNLKMAAMGAFEASNGQWSFLGDIVYSDLGDTKATPFGVLFSGATMDLSLTAISGYAMYRAVDNPGTTVDIGGGFRYYDLGVGATLAAGTLPGRTLLSGSESWVDPLLVVRAKFKLSDRWSLTTALDGGGFGIGSDSTWQVLGTADYALNERWTLRVGYRHLQVDKPMQGRDVKLQLSGPIIGATYRF